MYSTGDLLNRFLMDGIRDLFMVIRVAEDNELFYEYLNRAAMERTWLTEDAIGKRLREVDPPERFEVFQANHFHVIRTKREFYYEDTYVNADGQILYSACRLVPLLDERDDVRYITVLVHDITAQKRAELELAQSRERLHASEDQFKIIADHSRDLIAILDIYGKVEYISPSCTVALGYTEEEVKAKPFPYFVHPDDIEGLVDAFTDTLRQQRHFKVKYRMRHKTAGWIWYEIYGSPVFNDQQRINRVVGIARDISADKQVEERLTYYAYYDALSDLPNRRLFYEQLGAALYNEREGHAGVALLLLDIDRFKWINDQNGHDVGDKVIGEFARRVKGTVRRIDTVSRFGGDEFAVLLPAIASVAEAEEVVERIRQAIRDPWEYEDRCILVTSSIGLALSDGTMTGDELIKQADNALYAAKEAGRNCYKCAVPQ